MPLTPEDVSNKRFTPVRLREGYDMGEVDQFLDEVEAELARLTKENEDLRSKLSAAQSGASSTPTSAPAPAPPVPVAAPEPVKEEKPAPAPARRGARCRWPRPAAGVETIRVETVPQASNAAARLLELATRNADELVDEAKNEADKIVGAARTKAERLESEAKTKSDRLEADARQRSQMLDSETAERRQQMFGELEKERDKLNSEVETLRSFEREYRSRLKTYFTQQLESLQGNSTVAEIPDRRRSCARSGCARSWARKRADQPLAPRTHAPRRRPVPSRDRPFSPLGRGVWSGAPRSDYPPATYVARTTRPMAHQEAPFHGTQHSQVPRRNRCCSGQEGDRSPRRGQDRRRRRRPRRRTAKKAAPAAKKAAGQEGRAGQEGARQEGRPAQEGSAR